MADEIIIDDLCFKFPETVQHQFNEAKRYLLKGEKLNSIKSVREIFNMGIKEAKDVVDLWQETGREPDWHDLVMRYGYRKQSY